MFHEDVVRDILHLTRIHYFSDEFLLEKMLGNDAQEGRKEGGKFLVLVFLDLRPKFIL